MLKEKDVRQGKTIFIVRLDTRALCDHGECIWVMIPYLIMSKNYVRNKGFQSPDRRMNINKAKELIESCIDPLRYGVFTSRRKAISFQKMVTNYWANESYA